MSDRKNNIDSKLTDEIRILHLQSVGKILAGFTHEIKNHLAIINESVGLIGDMVQLGKSSQQEVPEYLQIIHAIEDQITRTNNHIRYLNRFAHRMDTDLSPFNINESIEELVALLTRFANQKKITLEKNFHDDIPSLYSNPALVQFVVFSLLQKEFSQLENNSKITIETNVANHSVQIKIISEGNMIQTEGHDVFVSNEVIDAIIKQLRGSIKKEQGMKTFITLPQSLTA